MSVASMPEAQREETISFECDFGTLAAFGRGMWCQEYEEWFRATESFLKDTIKAEDYLDADADASDPPLTPDQMRELHHRVCTYIGPIDSGGPRVAAMSTPTNVRNSLHQKTAYSNLDNGLRLQQPPPTVRTRFAMSGWLGNGPSSEPCKRLPMTNHANAVHVGPVMLSLQFYRMNTRHRKHFDHITTQLIGFTLPEDTVRVLASFGIGSIVRAPLHALQAGVEAKKARIVRSLHQRDIRRFMNRSLALQDRLISALMDVHTCEPLA